MTDTVPVATRRLDYDPPAFLIETVDLTFDLDPGATRVRSRLTVRRNPARGDTVAPLVLNGEAVRLVSVAVDGVTLAADRYELNEVTLSLPGLPDQAELEIETLISPRDNTELSGLYTSNGAFFTQCEAEGFRRITFFPDRPDVMARYTTTIRAPRSLPVLLSNGNPGESRILPDGRQEVRFCDPFPKPCYLFALVAGDLVAVRDRFRTKSGRDVSLAVWVRRGDENRCDHALASLKKAMAWDEETYGLEYDLDIFNIAAVADFNMGAMENKSLNIFNTKCVLARPASETDSDFENVQRVIAHEYFHNWTGDRVTCRDWFQLSLKEGLTVFRDQSFGADMGSAAVKRIRDVRGLRASQFPEDAGPLAHPVRPDSYIAIDNFYTPTIYEKGAEICRMLSRVLGREGFRRGMDCYIARHDGQAVTIEDFVRAIGDGAGRDLMAFLKWYRQAGTPEISVREAYDAVSKRYTLTLRQATAPTPGQAEKHPLPIPVAMGLLAPDGRELATRMSGETAAQAGTRLLMLEEAEQSFVFENVAARPVASLLRGFSAPVRLANVSRDTFAFLATHDTDPFVRWEAGQQHATAAALDAVAAIRAGEAPKFDERLASARKALLDGADADLQFAAEAMRLPGEAYLADQLAEVDPEAIHAAREFLRGEIGRRLAPALRATYARLADGGAYRFEPVAVGRRALRAVCLDFLAAAGEGVALAEAQFEAAANMTDTLSALAVLADAEGPARTRALDAFYRRWRGDNLVIDKWFSLQATSSRTATLAEVQALTHHADFDLRNPNRVRALIGAFSAGNPLRFHDISGAGYRLLADTVITLDATNAQLAARLIGPLGAWRRQMPARQALMRAEMERILARPKLSRLVFEKASKALA